MSYFIFLFSQMLLYSNPPIYRAPIYRVPRYNVPLCVPPISCFTIEHVLTFPRFTVPPIYRAFLLSPEKHGKSGDYCTSKLISLLKNKVQVFELSLASPADKKFSAKKQSAIFSENISGTAKNIF